MSSLDWWDGELRWPPGGRLSRLGSGKLRCDVICHHASRYGGRNRHPRVPWPGGAGDRCRRRVRGRGAVRVIKTGDPNSAGYAMREKDRTPRTPGSLIPAAEAPGDPGWLGLAYPFYTRMVAVSYFVGLRGADPADGRGSPSAG